MAIQFNLLPWREELRLKRTKQNQGILIAGAVLGLLVAGAYYGYESVRLSDHEKALSLIKKKNKALEPRLKEKKKLDKLKVTLNNQIDSIENLQADRASVTHMMEELSAANTQQLSLTKFVLADGKVSIEGIAENDAEVADLMKKLNASEWYQEPTLKSMSSNNRYGGEVKDFVITSQLLLPGTNKSDEDN